MRVATSEFRGNVVESLACSIQLVMHLLLDSAPDLRTRR